MLNFKPEKLTLPQEKFDLTDESLVGLAELHIQGLAINGRESFYSTYEQEIAKGTEPLAAAKEALFSACLSLEIEKLLQKAIDEHEKNELGANGKDE